MEQMNHRNPIELKENMGYYVVSGTIHLFMIKQSDTSEIPSKRHFLSSQEQGKTIYGGRAVARDGYYKLIAVGSGDTLVKSFTVSNAQLQAQEELQKKANEIERESQLKKRQYIEKKQQDTAALNRTVKLLMDNEKKNIFQLTGNIYFRTCQIVAKEMNQIIKEPKIIVENQHPYVIMKDYLLKTNLKYRHIKLNGTWWKNIDGMIIAFKENNQPIVLLPSGNSSYEMIDLDKEISIPVNEKLVGELQKDAFMIYRTLPEHELSGKDLLIYSLKRVAIKDISLFILILFGIGMLGMGTPIVTGLTVDRIIPQGDINLLTQAGIIMIVVAITSFLYNLYRGFIILRIESKLDVELQSAIWNRLINLPLSFFKQFSSAELASRALGITRIREIVSGPVMAMLLTSFYSIFSWLVLFYYNISLAVITSLLIGFCFMVNYFFAKKEMLYEGLINQLTNKLTGFSFQLIKGTIKIQQSGTIERAYYKWAKEQAKKHKAIKDKGIVVAKTEAFNGMFLPVSIGIIYYLITMQPAFSLPVGHFIGFNTAYMIFMTAMFNLFHSMHSLYQVLPLYERGKIILQNKPECSEERKAIQKELSGKIALDHVQFRYSPDGPDIINDVSFEINSGEYIGIVGTSGSGKSTLIRLLLGFETLNKGKITFDDQDINNLNLRNLRRMVGVVLQTGKLMTDSIYHNIIGTNLQLTMEDAWNAAKVAGIDEDIKAMPMGMHTVIMEGAGMISGGQKQRILIARALVNKPKILLLDEATSALDNITQAKIKQSLDQLTATRIVIAHRLSTVKDCDRILVMDQGVLKETGNYEELMMKEGIFYEIAKRQLI